MGAGVVRRCGSRYGHRRRPWSPPSGWLRLPGGRGAETVASNSIPPANLPFSCSIIAGRLSRKRLDFGGDQSVTVGEARVLTARDPAPPALSPVRGFDGDGARCRLSEDKDPNMPSGKIIKKPKDRPAGKRPATKTPHPKTARAPTHRSSSKQAAVLALLGQPKRTTSHLQLCPRHPISAGHLLVPTDADRSSNSREKTTATPT